VVLQGPYITEGRLRGLLKQLARGRERRRRQACDLPKLTVLRGTPNMSRSDSDGVKRFHVYDVGPVVHSAPCM